jgi:hypothetical protein
VPLLHISDVFGSEDDETATGTAQQPQQPQQPLIAPRRLAGKSHSAPAICIKSVSPKWAPLPSEHITSSVASMSVPLFGHLGSSGVQAPVATSLVAAGKQQDEDADLWGDLSDGSGAGGSDEEVDMTVQSMQGSKMSWHANVAPTGGVVGDNEKSELHAPTAIPLAGASADGDDLEMGGFMAMLADDEVTLLGATVGGLHGLIIMLTPCVGGGRDVAREWPARSFWLMSFAHGCAVA